MLTLTNLLECAHIHFVGIGGVSTSALASFLHNKGAKVTGSDANESVYTARLKNMGVRVAVPCGLTLMKGCELVVTNSAISHDNTEVAYARQNGIKIVGREILLGTIFDSFAKNVAVCGMHGKTTTSAMISHCLMSAGKDPTVFVGGDVHGINGNFAMGVSDICIAEACEYKANFLSMHPYVNCMLNLDHDHPDFYQSFEQIEDTFRQFAYNVKKGGFLVINGDDKNLAKFGGITFGLCENNDYRATDLMHDKGFYSFYVHRKGELCGKIRLCIAGRHNVYNALCAFVVLDILGVSFDEIKCGLESFCGVDRRCQIYRGKTNVVVDYAHHPSEIEAFLHTVSQMGFAKVRVVFQPHTYTRTRALFDQFVRTLEGDEIYLIPTYAAREKPICGCESHDLACAMQRAGKNVTYTEDLDKLCGLLVQKSASNDVILLVGAGDIDKLVPKLQ